MRFFSQFPLTDYKINGSNTNTSLIDIYRHVDVNETLIDDITSYRYYDIKDGERPDVVSHKLYGNPEYHWTFFIVNEKLNSLNDWPRSYNEQISYIDKKYDEYSVLEFIPSQEYIDNLYSLDGVPSKITISNVEGGNGEYTRISDGNNNEPRWLLMKPNGESVILNVSNYGGVSSFAWTLRNEEQDQRPFLKAPEGNVTLVLNQKSWLLTDWSDELTEGNPLIQPGFSFGDDALIKYNNYFNDIDFTDPNVRLKVKNTSHVAETVSYDAQRLQMWIKNISHNSFLSNDEQIYVLDYATDSEAEREEWLTDHILPWIQLNHRDVYNNLIADERIIIDNILPYLRGSVEDVDNITYDSGYSISSYETYQDDTGVIDGGDFVRGSINVYANDTVISLLYSDYLKNIELKTSRSWVKSYNAPYSYLSDDEYITTYDALTADPNNSNYITYFAAEEEENESKRNIRVLRSTDVEPFADYYKELINE